MCIKRTVLLLTLLIMATTAYAQGQQKQTNLPAPIQAMAERGVQIVGQFDTPGDLTAYAGIMGQRAVAIYLTADGKRAIVGTMIDSDGKLMNRETLQQMVAEPMSKRIWSQLENSTWVPDGDADAPRTVYVFSDPNCPYCYQFWSQSRPWVESGKVQLRHVVVGIIAETSDNKAAAILTADDPEQMLRKNKRRFTDGGITPMEDIPARIRTKLIANLRLMQQLGIRGTPGILYKDNQGHVQIWRGVPPKQAMAKVLGER